MSQTTKKHILKMKVIDKYVFIENLVGGGEVRVYLIELGPSRGLMATRV
jgi:hypothetical protein